jgi:anthranilate phosphoribosyltransferase
MIKEAIAKIVERKDLSQEEAEAVMKQIMAGETTPSQIGAFLTSLRMKGESAEEIAGCAQAMRAHALKVETRQRELIDTCGTGGDGLGTFNISTIGAFVVAGAGLPVAKHGNRSVSSRCGSADLLEALGARIDLGPEEVACCIDEVGFGFLFAQRLHPAMRNVAAPRKEIGVRTLFNLLGPLTNPASAPIQLMGVYSPALTETIAYVLSLLGTRHAMVVHSSEGLDELSLSQNKVTQLVGTAIKTFSLTPEEVGLPRADLKELQGGTPIENAALAWSLLKGEKGPKRDIVLLNAAAVLVIAGKADSFASGVELAAEVINSGKALDKLERFIALTQKPT